MQTRRGLRMEGRGYFGWEGLPRVEAGLKCRVGVACVWRGRRYFGGEGLPRVKAGLKCRVGVACVWRGRG